MKCRKFIILIFIYVITIFLAFYFSKIYLNSSNNTPDSFVSNYFFDVTGNSFNDLYNNINNYNNENNNYLIYVSSNNYNQLKHIENMLENVIKDDYRNKILYVNYSSYGKIDFINSLIDSFCSDCSKLNKDDLPVLICFRNKVIDNIVDVRSINEHDLNNLLEVYYD